VFSDALAAMVCYYGGYHVLTGYNLSEQQRATCAAVIAEARAFLTRSGLTPFVPMGILPDIKNQEIAD